MSYWIPPKIANLFNIYNSLGNESYDIKNDPISNVRVGLTTGDDFRFVRNCFEIPLNKKNSLFWIRFLKGGEFRPFENPSQLMLLWYNNGYELKNFGGSYFRNEHSFEKIGIVCPYISDKGICAQPSPSCNVFGHASRFIEIHDTSIEYRHAILGLLNSETYTMLLSCLTADRKHESSILSSLPIPIFSQKKISIIANATKNILSCLFPLQSEEETTPLFLKPYISNRHNLSENCDLYNHRAMKIRHKVIKEINNIDNIFWKMEELNSNDKNEFFIIASAFNSTPTNTIASHISHRLSNISKKKLVSILLSYLIGCNYGRWDIVKILNNCQNDFSPEEQLPFLQPGMLQISSGIPTESKHLPADYPLNINWDGIIVDDKNHPKDIVIGIRDSIKVIWQEKANDIENEACVILGIYSLREYFSKTANFFANHLKIYSISRRKSPIYWPLSTPSSSYTLWLYYHRLSDQILYTCVNDFVDPKLKQVKEDLGQLQKNTNRSTHEEKELEKLTNFELELTDFKDELLRIAKFWKPNLNDGVQITAAPLWKLFQHKPWQKKLKETWEKLEKGEYDWAHLAYSIWPERVTEKCRTDKSL
ncbi:MAG: hypothetical protein HQK65_23825, partial [Desulfamplus sp.]|nr:hypothetical protein [Desulfamplus sp.]